MLVGRHLGPYLIDKELGSGAMGAVYRARHQETAQQVAIKIIAPGLGTKDNIQARFQREASILKQLDHPHIVKLLGTGRIQKQPFFIMEFVEGESLWDMMERRGRITWEEVVTLGRQLCAGLQHAHDKGIVHRDLKPSNIMVLPDGTLKLTDFGIAKDSDVTQLTATNHTVGTAAYMAPEQCKGARDINHKADLYSLGVMLYELLTGTKPFEAETAMEMFLQHTQGTFERPSRKVLDIPIWLDTLVCQLLEKDPEKRPFSAEVVARALDQVKEKVEAQQSAGIDAARRRRADRTGQEVRLDEKDKEAARTLLGKKKKKKSVPVYQRGWFTIAGVAALVIVLSVGIYFLFIKAPSPESLIAAADRLMKAGEYNQARDGPIADFLSRYAGHESAGKVRAWADQIDLETREKQMHKRRGLFAAQGEAEALARRALENEDLGKLDEAAKLWRELAAYKDKSDPDLRSWGLVAEKYAKGLEAVELLHQELIEKIAAEKESGKETATEQKEEIIALAAMRQEAQEKWAPAKVDWNDLKKLAETQSDQRRWYLLAAKRIREIDSQAEQKKADKS